MNEDDREIKIIAITVFFSIATCIYVSFIGFLAYGHWTLAGRDPADCGGMIFLCSVAAGLTCAGICILLTMYRFNFIRSFLKVVRGIWVVSVTVAIVWMLFHHA